MVRKGVIKLFVIFMLAIRFYCCSSKTGDKNPANIQVNSISDIEGFVVKHSVIDQTITISGTIKPLEETVLMPEVAGRVVMINLQEGRNI